MNAPLSPLRSAAEESSVQENERRKNSPVRVMIVDDSLTVRTIFKRMVETDQKLEMAGTAASAERALNQLRVQDGQDKIDVILLDLEMPGMGGLEALPEILKTAEKAKVLVVSSLTEDGAEHTLSALSMGAADTMLKPRPGGFNEDYRSQLLSKIRALGGIGHEAETAEEQPRVLRPIVDGKARTLRPEVVAIGASTGGIHALNIMLRELDPSFSLPILITQHLPHSFIPVFARQIEVACGRPTQIAEDGTEVRAGEIVVATGHGHMMVRRQGERLVCKVSSSPARSGCLPSVDPMLSSLADACEGKVLAVILSGMGRDGAEGARDVVEKGGAVFAQDAQSSAVWGMPGAVAKAGLTSLVASPEKLTQAVMAQVSHPGER